MQDVVRESGVSPGAIYRYFSSKEQMVAALADERHIRERTLLARAAAQPDLATALGTLIDGFVSVLSGTTERAQRRLGVQLWAEALRDPEIRRVVRTGVDEPRRVLTALIAAARQRREIPAELSPDAIARAFIALFQGFVLQQAWDERAPVESYVEVLRAIVTGLCGHSEHSRQVAAPRRPRRPPKKARAPQKLNRTEAGT
jgi:TetR/AcrR family transcriptional regulator, transcriptional repressor of aconitase